MPKKKRSIKKYIILSSIVVVIIAVVIAVFVLRQEGDIEFESTIVERQNIIAEVGVTGTVVPSQSVDLAFEESGKIVRVPTDVGDRVFAGQVLAALDATELAAQLREAQANVASQQAKLDELSRGTRDEEVRVAEIKVANAQATLIETQKALRDAVEDAFTKADDSVRNNTDQLFTNPRSSTPDLVFTTSSGLENTIETTREKVENALVTWSQSLTTLESADVFEAALEAKAHLSLIQTYLDNVALAVNGLTKTADLSQTTIDGWRADVATARNNVNTEISTLSTEENDATTAQSNLTLAQGELELARAATLPEKIAAQRAEIEEARASVSVIESRIARRSLRAPFTGVVTLQDAKTGEIASANTVLVSVISDNAFEIEANIPEVDVASVNVENAAVITLDAYGPDVVFEATVSQIDPAETIVEGVATYGVTLVFAQPDERVRSGMTASIDIQTDSRESVIAIPFRAVERDNGTMFVRVVRDEELEEIPVTVGLRGSDGLVEITSGLSQGDEVVTFIEE